MNVTGVYISGLVNHWQTPFLLDTGATSSILSHETWRKSGHYHPERLEKLNATLKVANGEGLNIEGRTIVLLRLGNVTLSVSMLIVRNISHSCILGSDFFKSHGCQIRYDLGTLVVAGTEVPIFYQKNPPSVCLIVLTETVQLQPRH